MKKIFVFVLYALALSASGQLKTGNDLSSLTQLDFTVIEDNNDGSIKSVRYAETDNNIPTTAYEFFNETLKKREADDFVLDKSKETDYGMIFERYQQYYHGVKVVDGHYNFRLKNGRMKVVKGHYVNVTGINPIPSISEHEALNLYTTCFGIERDDILESYVELMIKEIPIVEGKKSVVALVYKVYLSTRNIGSNYVGYIDAHTGKLLYKEDALINYSTTGQFYTYYNRDANDPPKIGTTEYINNKYLLKDTTRGNGIYTYVPGLSGNYEFASDDDNIWTQAELGSSVIALDVHWTMEKIHDFLKNNYNHNSYDGAGHSIRSLIETGLSNAYYNNPIDQFGFGTSMGSSVFGPLATVDVIGHEFGHAILSKTAHFSSGQTGDVRNSIHEGLADIWGIIFEKHITPNTNCWMTGEQTMINGNSCMRNFQNPDDATAYTQISNTYGCGAFNSSDSHIKGGLLPYWFYLLSNGGSSTNGYNNYFQLIPVGFDIAEQLFAEVTLTPAYLEDCTTYIDIMYAFIDMAEYLDNVFLAEQVRNAWYAVGLNSEPVHIYLLSYAPGSATYYVYGNSSCSVNWSFTNGGSDPYPTLVPNSSNFSCTVSTLSGYSGYLNATIYCSGTTVTYSRYIMGAAQSSSAGENNIKIIPLDETHFRLSLGGEHEAYVKVYDALSLQVKAKEKIVNGKNYVLDTSTWKYGLYVVEISNGNQASTTKITIKKR